MCPSRDYWYGFMVSVYNMSNEVLIVMVIATLEHTFFLLLTFYAQPDHIRCSCKIRPPAHEPCVSRESTTRHYRHVWHFQKFKYNY